MNKKINRNYLEINSIKDLNESSNDFDEYSLKQISEGKTSVRDLEKNKRGKTKIEPNLIHEEKRRFVAILACTTS